MSSPSWLRRVALRTAAAALLAGMCHAACAADAYPSKGVQLVVPFAPGAGVDLVARMVAEQMTKRWGVPVVVDNRLGANGNIGTDFVAKASADGYTLLVTGPPLYINESLYRKIPYSPLGDFKPVVKISEAPLVLMAQKSAPVSDVKGLIAYARGRSGQLDMSSPGNGSTPHLAGALLNQMAGTVINHIPYKSGAQALSDVLGGQVFMTFTSVATGAQPARTGLAKALGVTGTRRSKLLPSVPTFAEQGLAGYEIVTWNGIFAPAATPDAIVEQIARTVAEIVADTKFTAALEDNGLDINFMDTPAFAASLPRESRKWKQLVDSIGVKAD